MTERNAENICVIGLGYVGLTLAVTLAESGFRVCGIEKNESVLKELIKGRPHFHEENLAQLLVKQTKKNLRLFSQIPDEHFDCFIIAVSTPVDPKTKKPKMDYVVRATREIVPHLKEGQLVMLRSTLPVGTTRNVVLPILQKRCKDFYLAFCPERTAEGKAMQELRTLPQVIGGLDKRSTEQAEKVFSKISPSIVKVGSLEAAEIVKLVNNSYRDMVFAYANQIALICKSLGLDANEVIGAANQDYPRSNVARPGLVGGYCLEKDPYILMDSAKTDYSLIKAAKDLNRSLVGHIVKSVAGHVKLQKKSAGSVKVFISGFAFKGKPETDDLRESPAIKLLELLRKNKFKNIYGHDFIVSGTAIKKLGVKPASLEDGFKNADVVIFTNNHPLYSKMNVAGLSKKMKKGGIIFDGWQMFHGQLNDESNIKYESLGFSN